MVSHPETGSDSPIGSDRDRGRDTKCEGVGWDSSREHEGLHLMHEIDISYNRN